MRFIDEGYSMALTEPRLVDSTKVVKEATELKAPMSELAEVAKI